MPSRFDWYAESTRFWLQINSRVPRDLLTKFIQLRPLKSKRAEGVVHTLLDNFTILGTPSVLQSNNDREFCNQILKELYTYNMEWLKDGSW